jgi:hypothetical protein
VPSPEQHIEWAKVNRAAYDQAVAAWDATANPVYLADAMRNAYGELINWMDAGVEQLAAEAKAAHDLCRELLERRFGAAP